MGVAVTIRLAGFHEKVGLDPCAACMSLRNSSGSKFTEEWFLCCTLYMCLKQKIVCVECSNTAVMYTARGGCGCHYSCMHGWLAWKGGVTRCTTYIVAQFTEELVKVVKEWKCDMKCDSVWIKNVTARITHFGDARHTEASVQQKWPLMRPLCSFTENTITHLMSLLIK